MSDVIEARGKAAFFKAGLDRLGARTGLPKGKPGMLYREGWAKNLTQGQTEGEMERRWNALPPEEKNQWASRGGAESFAPSEVAAYASQMGMVPGAAAAQAPAPAVNPGMSLDDKARANPKVAAAYAAKRAAVPSNRQAAPVVPGAVRPAINTEGKVAGPMAQAEQARRMGALNAAPDGRPVISDEAARTAAAATGRRVNPLTGLPFGYRPGDALPAAADAGMKQRAAESVTRQTVAAQTAIPRAIPVSEPVVPGSSKPDPFPGTGMFDSDNRIAAKRAAFLADEARAAGGSDEGLRAVGPKKPLGELVAGYRPPLEENKDGSLIPRAVEVATPAPVQKPKSRLPFARRA